MLEFADVPDLPGAFPVGVKKVVQNEFNVLEMEGTRWRLNTRVEMSVECLSPESTLVKISESAWNDNRKRLDTSYDNYQGWMQMSCCLKAFLDYVINLRKGIFLRD